MKKYNDPFLCDFIQRNLNKIPLKDIAAKCGISKSTMRKILIKNGMKTDPEASMRFRAEGRKIETSLTAEQDQYLKENYLTVPVKTMARNFGRNPIVVFTRIKQLGLVIPQEIKQQRLKQHLYKPGNIPTYKGKKLSDYLSPERIEYLSQFKYQKGHVPVNTLYDGAEVIKTDSNGKAYRFVRISAKNWKLSHVINYEKAYGKIPKGFCLRCKTEDTTNADPENWDLISKKENMLKNSGSTELSDAYVLGNLARNNPELKDVIKEEYPELVQLKKTQLILNRKIKNHEQNQNNRKN
jgi:methylphosphotriester-DNA--protein-cysteine methyltransferase